MTSCAGGQTTTARTEVPSNLITDRQLSERGGLSAKTLANWRWAGNGRPFIKLGSRFVIASGSWLNRKRPKRS